MLKNRFFFFLSSFCALALVLVVVSGCADDETPSAASPPVATIYYPQLAPIQPPSPKYEAVPILESPTTMLWKPGYWQYNGNDFDWVQGEVIARPSPTAVWFASYWIRLQYGWAFVPGRWQ